MRTLDVACEDPLKTGLEVLSYLKRDGCVRFSFNEPVVPEGFYEAFGRKTRSMRILYTGDLQINNFVVYTPDLEVPIRALLARSNVVRNLVKHGLDGELLPDDEYSEEICEGRFFNTELYGSITREGECKREMTSGSPLNLLLGQNQPGFEYLDREGTWQTLDLPANMCMLWAGKGISSYPSTESAEPLLFRQNNLGSSSRFYVFDMLDLVDY